MANATISALIKTFKESLSPEDLAITDTEALIDDIMNDMNKLGELSYEFMTLYDEYTYNNIPDASVIKEKLKEAIIKVTNDEIQ